MEYVDKSSIKYYNGNIKDYEREEMPMLRELWNQLLKIFGLDHLRDLLKAIFEGGNIMDVLR